MKCHALGSSRSQSYRWGSPNIYSVKCSWQTKNHTTVCKLISWKLRNLEISVQFGSSRRILWRHKSGSRRSGTAPEFCKPIGSAPWLVRTIRFIGWPCIWQLELRPLNVLENQWGLCCISSLNTSTYFTFQDSYRKPAYRLDLDPRYHGHIVQNGGVTLKSPGSWDWQHKMYW